MAYKRHIRNYLLDRKLQLRYTLMMVVLSSVLTAGLGYFWYTQMRTTSRTIEVRALATMSDEDVQRIKDEMASQDRLRLLVLVGFGVLFAFSVAGYGIVLTHKVAGPLFKISRYMNDMKEGKLGEVYDLRKGDQLRDFFDTFKQMHLALRKQAQDEVATLDEVIASTERHLAQAGPQASAGELARYLDSLRQLRDRKSQSLKS
jgi:nitrogen fixation/metabolism regulation signal transduction histidine kinase